MCSERKFPCLAKTTRRLLVFSTRLCSLAFIVHCNVFLIDYLFPFRAGRSPCWMSSSAGPLHCIISRLMGRYRFESCVLLRWIVPMRSDDFFFGDSSHQSRRRIEIPMGSLSVQLTCPQSYHFPITRDLDSKPRSLPRRTGELDWSGRQIMNQGRTDDGALSGLRERLKSDIAMTK
ncbi:hypothetical protein BJX66DRAFT_320879 [Aspergillus keveii]|uniref:Uncharacterized protein n=1 Tax=Aspergillus keveii TaxID=714993 RepID=A0ABR4FGL3_9EURO